MCGAEGVVITFSSHLRDRSSCLIKALMHNAAEKWNNERQEGEGKERTNGRWEAGELVKRCWLQNRQKVEFK